MVVPPDAAVVEVIDVAEVVVTATAPVIPEPLAATFMLEAPPPPTTIRADLALKMLNFT
jgi:hypothetical protein